MTRQASQFNIIYSNVQKKVTENKLYDAIVLVTETMSYFSNVYQCAAKLVYRVTL